nr:Tudor/PWWP/MBT superfamily protein isoform 1 [Tanacetum cinerariifolium]
MNEAQEDVDVVVVEEGLQVKDGNKDGVSVKLSLACSDGQNLLTELTLLSADNEPDKVIACSRAEEATAAQKKPNSDVHPATNSSKPVVVTYTEPEVIEIDTGVLTVKVEPVSPPTTGDTGNLQEDQGLTDISLTDIGVPNSTVEAPSTGKPQTYVEHSVLHVESEERGLIYMNICFVAAIKVFSPRENEGDFSVSDLVWGKVRSHPWWPRQIFDPPDASEQAVKHHKKDCFLVVYFGDQTFAWNESAVLKPFRRKAVDSTSNGSEKRPSLDTEATQKCVSYVFEGYERQYGELSAGLSKKCTSASLLDGVNILSWRVKLNNLPTRLNLSRRDMDIQSILCPSCNLAVESTNHIFFSCPMMKDLYKSIAR